MLFVRRVNLRLSALWRGVTVPVFASLAQGKHILSTQLPGGKLPRINYLDKCAGHESNAVV
jgi:hypothetical protein